MPHVFTYGSLMFADVFERVVRQRYKREHAQVKHFKRRAMRSETYPAVLPGYHHKPLEGVTYLDVSACDLRRLDIFEGHYYQRQRVLVHLSDSQEDVRAYLYVLKPRYRHLVSKYDWSADHFERVHLQRFVQTYTPD